MSRFVTDLPVNQPEEFVRFVSQDFFAKEGFELSRYKKETVWRKGMGLLTCPQFMKVEYRSGVVHLEAWMSQFALPGIYLGEMGVTGAWGWAVKQTLKSRVDTLIGLLSQQAPVPQAAAAAATDAPAAGQAPAASISAAPTAQQPIPVAVHDPRGKATASLVLGIVGLLAWLSPMLGTVIGIIGIVMGTMGRKSTARGRATAGLVMSILTVVASVGNFILSVYLMFSGIFW